MKARLAVVLVLAGLGACGGEALIGARYRAERELWHLNEEYRRLDIKPQLVGPDTWRALAVRYEDMAASYAIAPKTDTADTVAHELRTLVARSLISAAQIRANIGDSLQMHANYRRVLANFQDIPLLVAEVVLAQGRIAEAAQKWGEAASAYSNIVEHVAPLPGDPGVPGAVLELPLRVARLRHQEIVQAVAAGDTTGARAAARAAYADAEQRYAYWISTQPQTRLALEAHLHLADTAADQAHWQVALQELRLVEKQVAGNKESIVDAGNVRFSIALVQNRFAPAESTRATLLSLLAEYPQSPAAPQALLALANQAARLGATNDALDYLDRLRDDYAGADQLNAEGLLTRGRLLERESRWAEALDAFRNLPVRHPLSEPALQAPLEIVAHYTRVEDTQEANAALARAEREYRQLLARYPAHPITLSTRTKLVQTLALQKRNDEALTELLAISDALQGHPQGATYMLQAARFAYNQMDDHPRAAEILARLAKSYPNMDIGRWAAAEATRLQEGGSQ